LRQLYQVLNVFKLFYALLRSRTFVSFPFPYRYYENTEVQNIIVVTRIPPRQ